MRSQIGVGAKVLGAVAGIMLFPVAEAAAQTLTDVDTVAPGDYAGGNGAQVTVTFNALLQDAISLTLTGVADGAATTTIAGNLVPNGVVDFGAFNTLCSAAVANGECVRGNVATTTGNHLVASFEATVAFSGAATADVGISRDAAFNGAAVAPADVATVKFAPGLATAWTADADGTALANPLDPASEANLGTAVVSGTVIPHQVALFFPDTSLAGTYSTTVRWTATTN